ncbi:MAG: hypothetical protein IH626_17575 [Rhodospirillales bacterium]|nr:hypothetical protein [Rhodospirillales bacterium]
MRTSYTKSTTSATSPLKLGRLPSDSSDPFHLHDKAKFAKRALEALSKSAFEAGDPQTMRAAGQGIVQINELALMHGWWGAPLPRKRVPQAS